MKTLLVLLIIIIGISLVVLLPNDLIKSIIPGWKTTQLPDFIRYGLIGIFNIGLPFLFYIKLNKKVKPQIIVVYFLIINLLYLLQIFWPKNFVENGKINYDAYANYAWILVYIFIAAMIAHLIFYSYFLIKLVQKASANSGFAQ